MVAAVVADAINLVVVQLADAESTAGLVSAGDIGAVFEEVLMLGLFDLDVTGDDESVFNTSVVGARAVARFFTVPLLERVVIDESVSIELDGLNALISISDTVLVNVTVVCLWISFTFGTVSTVVFNSGVLLSELGELVQTGG